MATITSASQNIHKSLAQSIAWFKETQDINDLVLTEFIFKVTTIRDRELHIYSAPIYGGKGFKEIRKSFTTPVENPTIPTIENLTRDLFNIHSQSTSDELIGSIEHEVILYDASNKPLLSKSWRCL